MAKYSGQIGYLKTIEKESGVWVNEPVERHYYGDVIKNISKTYHQQNFVNNDITTNTIISIVSDPFVKENFQHIIFAEYMGVKWKVSNVEIAYPRILLTLGGIYNGQE